jgi:glycosyltransferase involved in cell wall biosynthesis
MRFHVLALPHTVTCLEYSACAFTQKVYKFCKMMTARGHTVYHYGHERSQVPCTKHISVTSDAILKEAYGDHDWKKFMFKHNGADFAHVSFAKNTIEALKGTKLANDFLLLFWGLGHKSIAEAHPDLIAVEPGIGCFNLPCADFCVYESYAVLHSVYAKHNMNPKWLDAVIPNYFEEDPDPVGQDDPLMKQIEALPNGFALMICRMVHEKGVGIAVDAAMRANIPIVLAGQEDPSAITSHPYTYLGYVEPKHRKALLKKARCLLQPSHYVEPFGGINVEAQFMGVPVITSDWGAYAETVIHGKTGFRCRTMEQFVFALKATEGLDKDFIQTYARKNYGFDKIGSMYEDFFSNVLQVYTGLGFYAENPGRTDLAVRERWP